MDSLEFPAGMLDDETGDPAGVALRELQEEVGLTVAPAALIPLSDRPLYTSPGLDDEAIHFFACEVELDDAEFHALEGGRGGLEEEGEHIRLGLWDHAEAIKVADSVQVHLAFHLYFGKLKGLPAP
jgi:8-oxo-dGTP pyrophosphatase MutT (NUDIX family)